MDEAVESGLAEASVSLTNESLMTNPLCRIFYFRFRFHDDLHLRMIQRHGVCAHAIPEKRPARYSLFPVMVKLVLDGLIKNNFVPVNFLASDWLMYSPIVMEDMLSRMFKTCQPQTSVRWTLVLRCGKFMNLSMPTASISLARF